MDEEVRKAYRTLERAGIAINNMPSEPFGRRHLVEHPTGIKHVRIFSWDQPGPSRSGHIEVTAVFQRDDNADLGWHCQMTVWHHEGVDSLSLAECDELAGPGYNDTHWRRCTKFQAAFARKIREALDWEKEIEHWQYIYVNGWPHL